MTDDRLQRLGYAIGSVLGQAGAEVVIGRDTRSSGPAIEHALTTGLAASGLRVALAGVLPSAGVALLVVQEQLAAGVVVSASHNPSQDNGVKIYDRLGAKLSVGQEREIEQLAAAGEGGAGLVSAIPVPRRISDSCERYLSFCLAAAKGLQLAGYRMVVDAANGAASVCAPELFRRLGAEVIELGCAPNGNNINAGCGVLALTPAISKVLESKADWGVVFDGDADRLIMIDAEGRVLDGDACLYILARKEYRSRMLRSAGQETEGSRSDRVAEPKGFVNGAHQAGMAGTLMSNQALEDTVTGWGLAFGRAAVGDRNVHALMRARGWKIGGEPSGHIILSDLHTTGDGILSALAVLTAIRAADESLTEAAAAYTPLPAELCSVKVPDQAQAQAVLVAAASRERATAGVRRVLVRPSGTEPVLRILVEADDLDTARASAGRLKKELWGQPEIQNTPCERGQDRA